MSISPQPDSPRVTGSDSERSQAQLRIDEEFRGKVGFRRLFLADAALALMQQQAPLDAWHLRSAVVSCERDADFGLAGIRAIHRSIVGGSLLANVHILQEGKPVLTCVGAYERRWTQSASRPTPPAWIGQPVHLPRAVEAWPELRDKECRDASAQLYTAGNRHVNGGFVRHRTPRALEPHDLCSLLEPWMAMPDVAGHQRDIEELVFEMHSPMPPVGADMREFTQVLVRRTDCDQGAEKLEAQLWTHQGEPLATVYARARLRR